MDSRIYIVDGARTPFLKAKGMRRGRSPPPIWPLPPAAPCWRRQRFAPEQLDEVILGCASPRRTKWNIGRVVALRMGICRKVPGWTVMRNCASGHAGARFGDCHIRTGRSSLVLAGGVDALSRPLLFSDAMVRWLSGWHGEQRRSAEKAAALRQLGRPYLAPVIGIMKGLTDPVVGQLMGQTLRTWPGSSGIGRDDDGCFRGTQPPARGRRTGSGTFRCRDRAADRS